MVERLLCVEDGRYPGDEPCLGVIRATFPLIPYSLCRTLASFAISGLGPPITSSADAWAYLHASAVAQARLYATWSDPVPTVMLSWPEEQRGALAVIDPMRASVRMLARRMAPPGEAGALGGGVEEEYDDTVRFRFFAGIATRLHDQPRGSVQAGGGFKQALD